MKKVLSSKPNKQHQYLLGYNLQLRFYIIQFTVNQDNK